MGKSWRRREGDKGEERREGEIEADRHTYTEKEGEGDGRRREGDRETDRKENLNSKVESVNSLYYS